MKKDKQDNLLKVLMQEATTGEKEVIDMGDMVGLKGRIGTMPDGQILALAEALDAAHTGIHEAMDVVMEEGAKRTARKMLEELKAHPEKVTETVQKMLRKVMAGEGKKKKPGEKVSVEELAAMEVEGHA